MGDQEAVLGGATEDLETGVARRVLEPAQVDVRGEVLFPDAAEIVLVGPVTVVREERPAVVRRTVEPLGVVPVVDDDGEAPLEASGHAGELLAEHRADLRLVPLPRCGPVAPCEGLHRRPGLDRRLDLRQRPVGTARAHANLPEDPVPADDTMDGERVEQLDGDETADPAARQPIRFDHLGVRGDPRGVAAHPRARVGDDVAETVAHGTAKGIGHVARQQAAPAAELDDVEGRRRAQHAVHLGELRRDASSERRTDVGGGEEVPSGTEPRPSAGVVTVLGVVERELHEAREGDRAVSPDLPSDPIEDLGTAGRRRFGQTRAAARSAASSEALFSPRLILRWISSTPSMRASGRGGQPLM